MENPNQSQALALEPINSNWIAPSNIEQGLKLAEMMAKAKLLPDHLRNDTGSCLLVLEQASRWGMSPFAVAQCTSVVHGRLCFEGKLVAAALSAMRAIEGRLEYEISGEGQNASIVVSGTPKGAKKAVTVKGTVKDWRTFTKKKDSEEKVSNAWDKQPEDMLIYRGTRQWARRYAPEAMLGVYTPDEFEEGVIDITPGRQEPPVIPATPETQTAPKTEEKPTEKPKKKEHPAIETARVLYKSIGKDGGPAIKRISKIHGGETPATVPEANMEAFEAHVKHALANIEIVEELLSAWEKEVAQ